MHPDCLSVLEPKAGDVVEEGGPKPKVKKLVATNFPLTGVTYDIIQRGGKPFFPPVRATE